MNQVISKLLKHFDRGTLTRRELMQGLALMAAAGTPASAAGFESSSISHVAIHVSDLKRSVDWYKKVFALSETSNQPNVIQLGVGKSYLSIQPGNPAGKVDHIAIGIDNFNQAAVVEELKLRGAQPEGLYVKDPDGLRVQLSSNDR